MQRRIKFRHLDAFSAIARAGSLKQAAKQLHLTQPAISRTLRELEDIVGTALMERSRAGVRLSPEGEVFLQFAEQSSAALRNGLRSLRAAGDASGQLRIGVLPSAASNLLPRAVRAFASAHPDALLEIFEGPHHELTARLRSGGLDMVVGRLGRPDSMQGLSFRQLYTEEVIVVTRTGGPAAQLRSLDALERFRVLYPPQGSAIRPLVARLLIAQGVVLYPNRIESASSAFGRAATLSDPQTVWFISRGVVAHDLEEGRLSALKLDTSATRGPVGVMSRAEEIPSPAARAFTAALSRIAKENMQG